MWISASDNWDRINAAGMQESVYPIHAEAHALPFADGFFDALVSMDAYHYFGTDDLYLSSAARLVRPGGQIGIVVPGLRDDLKGQLPEHLIPYWEPEYWSFHGPGWWRNHWDRSGLVRVGTADMIPHGWEHWLTWLEVCTGYGYPTSDREAEMVRVDAGRTLGFSRVVARRSWKVSMEERALDVRDLSRLP